MEMVSKPLRRNTHNTDNVLHGVRHRRELIVDRHELPYQIFNFVGELVPLLRRCISPFASRRTTFGTIHGDERRRGRGPVIFILTTHVSGYSIIRPQRFRNSPVASAVSSVCPLRSKCGPVNINVSENEAGNEAYPTLPRRPYILAGLPGTHFQRQVAGSQA